MPFAPSMTLESRAVLTAIRTRIFFVRKYLFDFASVAISIYYTVFRAKTTREKDCLLDDLARLNAGRNQSRIACEC